MLAFSTANDIGLPTMTSNEHPLFNTLLSLGDHYIEAVYECAVDAVEEAILNALIAAETVPIIKPSGLQGKAIDHERLMQIMTKYGR